jgi:hypothetical protein
MSQAYSRTPSEIFEVRGAAGLFFDKGLYTFGRWVESEVERAGQDALNAGFARSAQARAFAKCMGDDMETSSAGFMDPFAGAVHASETEDGEEILQSGY